MTNSTSEVPDTSVEDLQKTLKESNEDRKKDKLRRQVQRAHDWRVQVWAQCELKIRAANASLAALGTEEVEPFEPEFDNDEMLHHYSSMPLSK